MYFYNSRFNPVRLKIGAERSKKHSCRNHWTFPGGRALMDSRVILEHTFFLLEILTAHIYSLFLCGCQEKVCLSYVWREDVFSFLCMLPANIPAPLSKIGFWRGTNQPVLLSSIIVTAFMRNRLLAVTCWKMNDRTGCFHERKRG